jgi:DNA modification methylase
MLELNKIYCMDCLEGLKMIPDNSIDLVWTDPPYNIDYGYDIYKDKKIDYYIWCGEWIKESHRILKTDGSIFIKMWSFNIPQICWALDYNKFDMKNIIIWKRHSQAGYMDRFLGGYETILFYSKSKESKFYPDRILKKSKFTKRWDGKKEYKGRLHDIWTDIKPVTCGSLKHPEGIYKEGSGEKLHPAQHPTELVTRCVISTTNEGDTVLDPFMGSGTTAVACKQLQRNFIGFELSQKYVDIANKRLSQKQIFDYNIFTGENDE